jgi:hypothetical protein
MEAGGPTQSQRNCRRDWRRCDVVLRQKRSGMTAFSLKNESIRGSICLASPLLRRTPPLSWSGRGRISTTWKAARSEAMCSSPLCTQSRNDCRQAFAAVLGASPPSHEVRRGSARDRFRAPVLGVAPHPRVGRPIKGVAAREMSQGTFARRPGIGLKAASRGGIGINAAPLTSAPIGTLLHRARPVCRRTKNGRERQRRRCRRGSEIRARDLIEMNVPRCFQLFLN